MSGNNDGLTAEWYLGFLEHFNGPKWTRVDLLLTYMYGDVGTCTNSWEICELLDFGICSYLQIHLVHGLTLITVKLSTVPLIPLRSDIWYLLLFVIIYLYHIYCYLYQQLGCIIDVEDWWQILIYRGSLNQYFITLTYSSWSKLSNIDMPGIL